MANLLMSTMGGCKSCGEGLGAEGIGAGALIGGEAAKPEAQAKAQIASLAVIMIISQQVGRQGGVGRKRPSACFIVCLTRRVVNLNRCRNASIFLQSGSKAQGFRVPRAWRALGAKRLQIIH